MEMEESDIINLAVNIFQNVGIKRYIGHIEALRHEDIYFQIYKIIFPNSMINIFKISESSLTTGQKIQKIIEEISSIIKLDLYHISGQQIAQGNKNHLTNWLQLLEALSNNCIEYQTYHGGGSEPDRNRDTYKEFEDEEYFTVQGVDGEFEKPIYTDQKPDDTDEQEDQQNYQGQTRIGNKNKNYKQIGYLPHHKKNDGHLQELEKREDPLNRSFRKSDSSRNSNVLKPIDSKKNKNSSKVKKSQNKKVTFKIEDAATTTQKNTRIKKKISEGQKGTSASLDQPVEVLRNLKHQNWAYPLEEHQEISQAQKLIERKKAFILKIKSIEEQMQKKKINDEVTKFQSWVLKMNRSAMKDSININQQSEERTRFINSKIAERQTFLSSLTGRQEAITTIKQIFKRQKQNEKRVKRVMQEEETRQALQLMNLNFAIDAENRLMASIRQ